MDDVTEALRKELALARQHIAELEGKLASTEELESSRSMLDALLTSTPDFIYFKDTERRYVRVSDSVSRLLGSPVEDYPGKRTEDFMRAETIESAIADEKRVINEQATILNQVEGGEVSPGKEVWVTTTKQPWLSADGACRGLFGISRDITDLKKATSDLEKSERLMRQVTESIPVAMSITQVKGGRLLFVNGPMARFLGRTAEELVGSKTPDLYANAEDRAAFMNALKRDGKVEDREIAIRRHDGEILVASVSAIPMEVDGEASLLASVRDITELKASEHALREAGLYQERLLREVNHRVGNNLSALLAIVGQEKRKPDSKQVDVLDTLGQMERRIRGLATVHTMLSDTLWRPLPLLALCEQLILATIQGNKPMPQISCRGAKSLVSSDQAQHVATVIVELTLNALKYSVTDGPLQLTVTATQRKDCLQIEFRDNGCGYPDAVLASTAVGGLGLKLVRGIIGHSTGGRLTLKNMNGAVALIEMPTLPSEVDAAES